ncbi:MAG: hypothetical protein HY924_05340 [Elusimicrobia bacterium]|nr:hypothetical protein [Elusimicrobiota bacterium]
MRRRTLLLWALSSTLLLAPAPTRAFLWFGPARKTALLWVPAETFSDWEGVAAALARHRKLAFTAALSPSMASPETRALLQPFVAEGRLEIAFRVDGDPVLPLIHDHPETPRPQDSLELLSAGLARHRQAWGDVPVGFAPAGGLLHPDLLPLLRSLDLAWVAGGDDHGQDRAHRGMPLLRCRAVTTIGRDLSAVDVEGAGGAEEVIVLDEAGGAVPEGAWTRLLFTSPRIKAATKRLDRVRDASARRRSGEADASGTGRWLGWTGVEDAWSRSPEQKAAWRLYGDTARAVSESRNAGAGPKAVAAATASLRSAQSGRLYRDLAHAPHEKAEEADRELRKRLIGVYKALRLPTPESLLVSVLTSARTPGRAFDAGSGVACRQGPNWFSCDNPSPGPSVREDPRWRIASFRVHWDEETLTLVYRMGRLSASSAASAGFEGLVLGTYIDLNHVPGAGSTKLIEILSDDSIVREDAWEAALTVSGWGAALHRATPRGEAVLEHRAASASDTASSEVTVSLPRTKLRGNPALWGWTVTAAEPGEGGTSLRGILAERVLQRRLGGRRTTEGKAAPGVRLNAVRPGKSQGL